MNPSVWNIFGLRKHDPQVWMSLAAFLAFWAMLLAGVNLSVRELDDFGESFGEPTSCLLAVQTTLYTPLQVGRSVALAAGQAVAGSLEPGHPIGQHGYYDAWTFSADEGERFVVRMDSGDFDSYLQVLKDDGTQIAFDDDSGTNYNARVGFLAPETGQYTILAASLIRDEIGQYVIQLERVGGG